MWHLYIHQLENIFQLLVAGFGCSHLQHTIVTDSPLFPISFLWQLKQSLMILVHLVRQRGTRTKSMLFQRVRQLRPTEDDGKTLTKQHTQHYTRSALERLTRALRIACMNWVGLIRRSAFTTRRNSFSTSMPCAACRERMQRRRAAHLTRVVRSALQGEVQFLHHLAAYFTRRLHRSLSLHTHHSLTPRATHQNGQVHDSEASAEHTTLLLCALLKPRCCAPAHSLSSSCLEVLTISPTPTPLRPFSRVGERAGTAARRGGERGICCRTAALVCCGDMHRTRLSDVSRLGCSIGSL